MIYCSCITTENMWENVDQVGSLRRGGQWLFGRTDQGGGASVLWRVKNVLKNHQSLFSQISNLVSRKLDPVFRFQVRLPPLPTVVSNTPKSRSLCIRVFLTCYSNHLVLPGTIPPHPPLTQRCLMSSNTRSSWSAPTSHRYVSEFYQGRWDPTLPGFTTSRYCCRCFYFVAFPCLCLGRSDKLLRVYLRPWVESYLEDIFSWIIWQPLAPTGPALAQFSLITMASL